MTDPGQPAAETVYPCLRPVTVTPVDGKPDEYIIALNDQPGKVVVGGGAAVVLREFDGRRSAAAIATDLQASGVPVPGPDFVLALAQAMARAGLVELRGLSSATSQPPRDLISIDPLRHQCIGCGRSCEGHSIGPLDQPFLDRLPHLLDELVPLHHDLTTIEEFVVPVEHDGHTLYRLAYKPGRGGRACVFLGEDRLCRIHGHFGPAAKPLICRLFPLEVVQAEDGLRVGITRCFQAHKSYKADIPEQTPGEITGIDDPELMNILVRGLDATNARRMVNTPEQGTAEWRNQRMEQGLLMLLEAPWSSWGDLFAFVSETTLIRRLPTVTPLENPAFVAALVARIRTSGAVSLVAYEEQRDEVVPGGYLENLFQLFEYMRDLPEQHALRQISPSQRDYGFHTLREAFFLRSWHKHPSFQVSALIGILGVLVAAWMAEDAGEQEKPGEIGDVFAYGLTTWMRYFNYEKHVLNLFQDLDDYLGFVGELEAALVS